MKLLRDIHLWLSVPFGIIITLVCFSGAMLVFEPEITRAVRSDVYYAPSASGTPLPVGELMESVKATLPDSIAITGVTIFADPSRTWQVSLSKPRRASLFVDPYTGRITGRYERLGFFSTMFRLHRWLLDSANPHGDGVKVGKLIVGISTLAFVIALITGAVIWVPRARRNLRRSLSIPLHKGANGFWQGLHVAGSMYALVLVLAMALTGLTWSFGWYRAAFYAVCGVEQAPRGGSRAAAAPERGRRGDGRGDSGFGSWQRIYETLRAERPEAPQIAISRESASVALASYGNTRASDRYEFNRRTGEVSLTAPYNSAVGADKLRGWIYSIHTGSLGGIATRILWLLAALLGASLPLTGYYIWIRRLIHRHHATHHS